MFWMFMLVWGCKMGDTKHPPSLSSILHSIQASDFFWAKLNQKNSQNSQIYTWQKQKFQKFPNL
jgi:hypothetical protein